MVIWLECLHHLQPQSDPICNMLIEPLVVDLHQKCFLVVQVLNRVYQLQQLPILL
jgi:hypothetical protein